jgi:sucrose phosphorylase
MRNAVQLICYADRLGGTLQGLRALLAGPFSGLFGGVHVLPFFHPIDGADAGFDPIDHTRVDARLGDWEDVRSLAADAQLMADVIVNHVSSRSPQFQDYLAHGAGSRYDGLFLTQESVFPHGATAQELQAIYRPRPGLPFTPVTLADGSPRTLWTTFTPSQSSGSPDSRPRWPPGLARSLTVCTPPTSAPRQPRKSLRAIRRYASCSSPVIPAASRHCSKPA